MAVIPLIFIFYFIKAKMRLRAASFFSILNIQTLLPSPMQFKNVTDFYFSFWA